MPLPIKDPKRRFGPTLRTSVCALKAGDLSREAHNYESRLTSEPHRQLLDLISQNVLLVGFRKSTATQNRQLILYYYYSNDKSTFLWGS